MRKIVLAFLISLSTSGLADAQATRDTKEASAHYRQGKAFYAAKVYDQAAAEFKHAYALAPKTSVLCDIGLMYRLGGDTTNALEYYKKYIELDPAGEVADEAREAIIALSKEAEKAKAPAVAPNPPMPAEPQAAASPTKRCTDLSACVEECVQKIASSCREAGRMSESSEPRADNTKAGELYFEGCFLGDGVACGQGGRLYFEGAGVPQDYSHALTLYQKGCDRAQADACGRLGWMFANGQGTKPNGVRAFELFRRACEARDPSGCHGLGVAYSKGDPVPIDLTKADAALTKGCQGNQGAACFLLGQIVEGGRDGTKDVKRALELYVRSCDLGTADGCFAGGRIDQAQEPALFSRGCRLRPTSNECEANVMKKEVATNLDAYRMLCEELRGTESCFKLGQAYATGRGVTANPALTAKYFDLGCKHGNMPSCRAVAPYYERGLGEIPLDAVHARELYEAACKGHVAESCFQLYRVLHDQGDGAAADLALRDACRGGFEPACKL